MTEQTVETNRFQEKPKRWLNRNIVGMGIASFLSDMGHEMATAILPMFLGTIGASAAALGVIEGVADAVSSFVKLGAGYFSDKSGRRKPIAVMGYVLTGIAKGSFALATSWVHILIGRIVGWLGRGIRGPVRDAMLAESVEPNARGRAFGFHRAADTSGAVVGPLVAFLLVSALGYREIFLITLIPGLLSAAAFALFVKGKYRAPNQAMQFAKSFRALPKKFKLFLVGIGIFGIGDFAHTLLILRASQMLSPSLGVEQAGSLAVLLYTCHNVLYAAKSYPIGALSDKIGKRNILVAGYFISALMCLGFIVAIPTFWYLILLFALGGIYIAIEDAMEGAMAADLLPEELRGTGYGVLATVNGIGDFASSIVVGLLWSAVSPEIGFGYSALLSILGGILILRLR